MQQNVTNTWGEDIMTGSKHAKLNNFSKKSKLFCDYYLFSKFFVFDCISVARYLF